MADAAGVEAFASLAARLRLRGAVAAGDGGGGALDRRIHDATPVLDAEESMIAATHFALRWVQLPTCCAVQCCACCADGIGFVAGRFLVKQRRRMCLSRQMNTFAHSARVPS